MFVQTLFNRLMFVYFLQRKNWLELRGDNDSLNTLWKDYQDTPDQTNFYTHGAQLPMSVSRATIELSPFDDPHSGATLVLIEAGGVKGCYAVGSDLQPWVVTAAQLTTAARCLPETPVAGLPSDTNRRVTAAVEAFRLEVSRRLGSTRRQSDTRNRRHLSCQLHLAECQAVGEETDTRAINTLRCIFLGELPSRVENHLTESRRYTSVIASP